MTAPAAMGLVDRFRAARGAERDAAFEAIFVEHRRRILALCLHLCRSPSLAEDALQETFLEVYKGLDRFRGESSLGTWIYRIAMRTALRLRARQPDGAALDDAPPPTVHPDDELVARDHVRRVRAAMDELPAEQRVVVALFAIDGLGHGEIAEILGVPVGTVWSRLHQGRKALARAIAA